MNAGKKGVYHQLEADVQIDRHPEAALLLNRGEAVHQAAKAAHEMNAELMIESVFAQHLDWNGCDVAGRLLDLRVGTVHRSLRHGIQSGMLACKIEISVRERAD